MWLTSVSPTSSYPGFDLDRYARPTRAVHNGVHTFNHRLLQPALSLFASIFVALDDHLVVANKDRHGPWTLIPTLPQEDQRKLQAVGAGALDRGVQSVGQLLDVHAAPAGKRPGL